MAIVTDDLQPERRGSFWKTVPGVLTAIAGLITALVGLVALMVQIGSAATSPSAKGPTVEVSTHLPTSDPSGRNPSGPNPPTSQLPISPGSPEVDVTTRPPTSTPPSSPKASSDLDDIQPKDCVPYVAADLRIVDEGASGWLLTDGVSRMEILDNQVDAQRALALAQRHTAHCFIGRDNTRPNRADYIVEYWAGDSGVNTVIQQPDCIAYRTAGLRTVDEGSTGWLLTDGVSRMVILDSERDAGNALLLARSFTNQCFVGRGNTRPDREAYIVQYWQ